MMRNAYLELIRGIAALVVFLSHFVNIYGVKEVFGNSLMLINWGTEAVIVFFLLSGTVIRLSMESNPRSKLKFFQRRIARIFPLYIIALILTMLVSFITMRLPSLSVILGHLLFLQTLQGYICQTMWANMPLWSLSFEIFFYLAYTITIGKYQKNLLRIWGIISFVALIIQAIFPLTGIYGHVTIMFAYSSIWLLGYYLVDLSKYVIVSLIQAFAWLGLLPMAARLHLSQEYYLAAKHFVVALMIVPLFIFLINKSNRIILEKKIRLKWSVWIIAYTILSVATWTGQSLLISKVIYILAPFLTPTILVIMRLLLLKNIWFLQRYFLIAGQMSYALYIVHFPIIRAVDFLSVSLRLKLILAIMISLIFAYILEFYLHPPLARKILGYSRTNS